MALRKLYRLHSLAIILTACQVVSAAPVFEAKGTESVEITRNAENGMLKTVFNKVEFEDVRLFNPDRRGIARTTIQTEYDDATEGENSRAKVEFFMADGEKFPKTPTQTIDIPDVSQVKFRSDHWAATTFGCCDAEPYTRLYAYGESSPFLRFNSGYAMVEIPNANQNRYVGMAMRSHVPKDSADEAIFGKNKQATLSIAYAAPGKPLQRILLQPKAGVPEERVPYHTLGIRLISSSPKDTPGWQETKDDPTVLTMWSNDPGFDSKQKFEGVSNLTIISEIDGIDGTTETIKIPVSKDKFGTPVIQSKALELVP